MAQDHKRAKQSKTKSNSVARKVSNRTLDIDELKDQFQSIVNRDEVLQKIEVLKQLIPNSYLRPEPPTDTQFVGRLCEKTNHMSNEMIRTLVVKFLGQKVHTNSPIKPLRKKLKEALLEVWKDIKQIQPLEVIKEDNWKAIQNKIVNGERVRTFIRSNGSVGQNVGNIPSASITDEDWTQALDEVTTTPTPTDKDKKIAELEKENKMLLSNLELERAKIRVLKSAKDAFDTFYKGIDELTNLSKLRANT